MSRSANKIGSYLIQLTVDLRLYFLEIDSTSSLLYYKSCLADAHELLPNNKQNKLTNWRSFLLIPAFFRSLSLAEDCGAINIKGSVFGGVVARIENKTAKKDGSWSFFAFSFCLEERDGDGGGDIDRCVNSAKDTESRATSATKKVSNKSMIWK